MRTQPRSATNVPHPATVRVSPAPASTRSVSTAVLAAADAHSAGDPALSQETADNVAVILARYLPQLTAVTP